MLIPCPFCGPRDAAEFAYRGDADIPRPGPGAPLEAVIDAVYFRANPAGPIRDLWYHRAGCRSWLVVTRDTRSHEVTGARLARAGEDA